MVGDKPTCEKDLGYPQSEGWRLPSLEFEMRMEITFVEHISRIIAYINQVDSY